MKHNKMDKFADAIITPFPQGITDEQIIWQVIDRKLLDEVVCHMSDSLLFDTWFERNKEQIKLRNRNQWIKIPKDKYGFFEDDGTMYEALPVLVTEVNEWGDYSFMYVDKENWGESVSDFSKRRFKYYLPIPKLPNER